MARLSDIHPACGGNREHDKPRLKVVLHVVPRGWKHMNAAELAPVAQVCAQPPFDLLVHLVRWRRRSSARLSASLATVG